MSPLLTYQVYSSIQLHFTSPKYNWTGRPVGTFSAAAFEKRKDIWQFNRISKFFPNTQELAEFCFCWFYEKGGRAWVGEADPNNCAFYDQHRKYMGNALYHFEATINKLNDSYGMVELLKKKPSQLPKIIELCTAEKSFVHTFTLLDRAIKLGRLYDEYYEGLPEIAGMYGKTVLPIKKFAPLVILNSSADVKKIQEIVLSLAAQ